MTADPKAPGAPAVFLNREEKTDNANHYVSSYARIKVLTELGKEWATVEVPYSPGINAAPIIEGRTIHPDGTVIPLVGKASDLLVYKARGTHLKAAVFNLPSVEVGSILEYRWTIPLTGTKDMGEGVSSVDLEGSMNAGQVPEWDVQKKIYIHKEHFYYDPNADPGSGIDTATPARWMKVWASGFIHYTAHLPAGAKVALSPAMDYTLDVADVPPIAEEANAPPVDSIRFRVQFYLVPFADGVTFWINEHERWLSELNQFAAQSQTIRDAAREITLGASSPEEKARKLYDAVQALENTDFARAKSAAERKQLHMRSHPKSVQDVWNEKSGWGNDLAALYLALARAAGLDANAMQVADRRVRVFDINYLTLLQLDTLLVVVRVDGTDIYLDPGEKFCPFGQLHWAHTLSGGLRENTKFPVYTPANLPASAMTARNADLTVDQHGAVSGKISVLITGPAAVGWRQLVLTAGEEEARNQFAEFLRDMLPQGVVGEIERIQGLDSIATSLSAVIKVKGQLGTSTGKRLFIPGFLFSTGDGWPFVTGQERDTTVDLHYAVKAIDDVIYHLPEGATVESAPHSAELPWPSHAALVVKTTPGPGVLEIKRSFVRAFVLLQPKEYPALRDYYQKIAVSDQQQLVLAPAAGAAGN